MPVYVDTIGPAGVTPEPGGFRRQRKIDRALSRYALSEELGRERGMSRAARRLSKFGITDPEARVDLMGETGRRTAIDDLLFRKAKRGALGGKAAKRLNALLEINRWGQAARTEGLDTIGSQYGDLATNLRASFGDIDLADPAMASILAGVQEGRQTDTQRFLTNIEQQQSQARESRVGSILDETGALVEALKRLEEEEDALAKAQRGAIYGGALFNPVRGIGSLIGGGVGGREGSMAGGNASMSSIAELFQLLQAATNIFSRPGTQVVGPGS